MTRGQATRGPHPDELAAFRLLARGLCHDVKSFLMVTSLCGAIGAEADDPAEVRDALERILAAEPPARKRVETFGRFVAGTLVRPVAGGGVDLAEAAGAALEVADANLRTAGVAEIERSLAPAIAAVPADRALAIALLAILNAALLVESREEARISVATAPGTESAELRVELEASGLAPVDAPSALARSLEDTLSDGRLPLAALGGVRAIAEAAGGRIAVTQRGSRIAFEVQLPARVAAPRR